MKNSYPYDFSLNIFFGSAAEAKVFSRAVLPEMQSAHLKRSVSRIKVKKNMVSVSISSLDMVALRASAHGLLKKFILVKSILEVE